MALPLTEAEKILLSQRVETQKTALQLIIQETKKLKTNSERYEHKDDRHLLKMNALVFDFRFVLNLIQQFNKAACEGHACLHTTTFHNVDKIRGYLTHHIALINPQKLKEYIQQIAPSLITDLQYLKINYDTQECKLSHRNYLYQHNTLPTAIKSSLDVVYETSTTKVTHLKQQMFNQLMTFIDAMENRSAAFKKNKPTSEAVRKAASFAFETYLDSFRRLNVIEQTVCQRINQRQIQQGQGAYVELLGGLKGLRDQIAHRTDYQAIPMDQLIQYYPMLQNCDLPILSELNIGFKIPPSSQDAVEVLGSILDRAPAILSTEAETKQEQDNEAEQGGDQTKEALYREFEAFLGTPAKKQKVSSESTGSGPSPRATSLKFV